VRPGLPTWSTQRRARLAINQLQQGGNAVSPVHGLHALGGLFYVHADGGNKKWPPAFASHDRNAPRRVAKAGLGHSDDSALLGKRLMEDGAEPGSVIAIKPDIAVDNDCRRMSLELLQERERIGSSLL